MICNTNIFSVPLFLMIWYHEQLSWIKINLSLINTYVIIFAFLVTMLPITRCLLLEVNARFTHVCIYKSNKIEVGYS